MISPKEHWTTLVALTCFVVFFLGHLGISLDNVADEESRISRRVIDENIIADEQGLAKGQKRDSDRFAEAEKRSATNPFGVAKRSDTYPYGVSVKRSDSAFMSDEDDHEPPTLESLF